MATLHVEPIYSNAPQPQLVLRAADQADVDAAGFTTQEALGCSIRLSAQAWRIAVDGETVCCWGHAPATILGNIGVSWLMTTPAVNKHQLLLARFSHRMVAYLLSLYHEVFVQVALDHKQSRRWLRWLGFEEISRSGRFATMRKVQH